MNFYNTKKTVLFAILYSAKYIGIFSICRAITHNSLRVLCYHGCSLGDEHEFSPGTFMRPSVFQRRMEFLVEKGYAVLPLSTAVEALRNGTLRPGATAITIDDGWYGTYAEMYPVLRGLGLPATLYIATYYVQKPTQVLNMVVRYLAWARPDHTIDLSHLAPALTGCFRLSHPTEQSDACERIIQYGHTELDHEGRQDLVRRLAAILDFDIDSAEEARLFRFVTADEVGDMAAHGIDIQLHTHRHRFPTPEDGGIEPEIHDNRSALATMAPGPFEHFCYPSGDYDRAQLPLLEDMGVVTATTTEPGFNYATTPPLLLRRFLDSDTITEIEFEAEMCGFFEIIRRTLGIKI